MRSSKSRSRGKNRSGNRSPANNINRVFDSSGPEGKVRGTPQQIIDKYTQLARDAQLSNDRVAAENFSQHAEHYTRMLAEAMRDVEEKRQQNDQQNRDRQQNDQQNRDRQQNDPQKRDRKGGDQNRDQQGGGQQPRDTQPRDAQPRDGQGGDGQGGDQPAPKKRSSRSRKADTPSPDELPSFISAPVGSDNDSGLVETPESAPKKTTRSRKPKAPKAEAPATDAPASGGPDSTEAAE